MDRIAEFFRNFQTQVGGFWASLSTPKKAGVLSVIVAIFGSIILLSVYANKDDYEYLYRNLEPVDTQSITQWLRSNSIPFVSDSEGIRVPTENVPDIRLRLASEGLPNHQADSWKIFDDGKLSMSRIEGDVKRLRAIQGELSRTIMLINNVVSAKVHIVMPRQAVFTEDQKKTTAAVYIKSKNNRELDRASIRGIVHLVSRAVEGLSTNNVTIIDHDGRMLTEIEATDHNTKMTKEMIAFKKNVETQMTENIRNIVGRVVGPDRVEVRVNADVDFTEETQTISDIDPEKSVVISKQVQGFQTEGNGFGPTGIPGAKSNTPGDEEDIRGATATSGVKNSKDSERVNYDFKKMVSEKRLPVGNIKRVTAAVLVDGMQEYKTSGVTPEFVPRSEGELKQIEDLVKSAIGFSQGRGDLVTVRNLMFQLDQFQFQEVVEEEKVRWNSLMTIFVSGAISLAVVLFFFFVVRPYFHWLSYDPEKKSDQQIVEEFRPDLELGSLQSVQVKEDVPFEKLSVQEQVLYLARNEPARTTEAIRLLLNPHHGN